MAKLSLISLNILLVLALKIFFGGDVTVVQKMQPNIKPGETLIVELEITKGDREGFAKWQQKLPTGFIASSLETDGATFSFKNQEIKVIWMALPEKETFSIKYQIETSAELSGDYNLSGKFSYIEENERKDVSSEIFILTVGDDEVAVSQTEINEEEEPSFGDDLMEEVSDAIIAIVDSSQTLDKEEIVDLPLQNSTEKILDASTAVSQNSKNTVVTKAAQGENVTISRTVKHLEKGDYLVTLNLSKGDLNSFGKIEDYLPPDYIASENTSNQGIFSFKGNVVKILWMTLPAEENIEVSYNLKSTSDELDSAVIHGVFSFLNVDESNQTKLAPSKFRNFLAEDSFADETMNSEDDNQAEKVSIDPLVNDLLTNNDSPSKMEKKAQTTEDKLVSNITNIPAPETAVSYKVQIAAARKEVTQQYFIDRHNISEPVAIEYHESWYKYTVGGYAIYKDARDKRNKIWADNNKINDAFVAAYNSGERISVQEALMISKQKWFK